MNAFLSNPDDIVVHESGWFKISDTLEMTKVPLIDQNNFLFARLGAKLASQQLSTIGARLPKVEEYDILHKLSYHIEPVVLPTNDMLKQDNVDENQIAIQNYREHHMMTLEWCQIHDKKVWELLSAEWSAQNLNESLAVDNCGKHWCLPNVNTPPGHSLIYGWWTPYARKYGVSNDVMIQTPSPFHDNSYDDYGTTYHGVRAIVC